MLVSRSFLVGLHVGSSVHSLSRSLFALFEDDRLWGETLGSAVRLAAEVHGGQVRWVPVPGVGVVVGEPYLSHPLRVAVLVSLLGAGREDLPLLVEAAVFHDVVEDGSLAHAGRVPGRVRSLVDALSTPDGVEGLKMVSREAYVEGYVEHVGAVVGDVRVGLVKLADMVDNIMSAWLLCRYAEDVKYRRMGVRLVEKYSRALGLFEGISEECDGLVRLGVELCAEVVDG